MGAFLLFLFGPGGGSAKLSDIRNLQIIVEKSEITSPDEIGDESTHYFEKYMRDVKVSREFADVKFHILFQEQYLPKKKQIAYNHQAHVCGLGTDKYGTFEKVYWSKAEGGVTTRGQYPGLWRRHIKGFIKTFSRSADEMESFTAQVVKVPDGDTLSVIDQGEIQNIRTVRLYSVDCPESSQRFGLEARNHTASLVMGQVITIKALTVDRYGRVLGDVVLPDGRHLSRELVREGLAWWYSKYSDDPVLAKLEEEAEKAGRGLWADRDPVPPWEYRKESDEGPFKSKRSRKTKR